MSMIKDKRGVSAIELIVSFVLFLSLLAFVFYYFNPIRKPATISLTESLAKEIERDATLNLEVIGISADLKPDKNCFKINNPFPGRSIFVLNEIGHEAEFITNEQDLFIK